MGITARIDTRRKLMDIPENVFQALNINAAAMGTNLKKYIEEILIRECEDMMMQKCKIPCIHLSDGDLVKLEYLLNREEAYGKKNMQKLRNKDC